MLHCYRFRSPICAVVYFLTVVSLILATQCVADEYLSYKKTNTSIEAGNETHSIIDTWLSSTGFREKVNEYLGTPYRYGGTSRRGIDCSGLTQKVYLEIFGLSLPHNSAEQSRLNIFENVPLDPDTFESSDLLFFSNHNRINHVAIYLEDGKFLHALPKRGVVISSLDQRYWKQRLVASRRIKDAVLAKIAKDADQIETTDTGEISIGYTADVDRNINLTLGTFYFGAFTGKNASDSYQSGWFDPDPGSLEPWQGLQASADIFPLTWLRISPTLGMLEKPSWWSGNDSTTPWLVYGLETFIAPASSQWSLALSLYSLSNDSYFSANENTGDTDIGLHLNYSLTSTMHLSFTANWEGSSLFKETKNVTMNREIQNVSLKLGFIY